MFQFRLFFLAAVIAFVAMTAPGFAHITIEQRQAMPGSPVKLTFRVPHGCGDSPTVKLRVRIPDGVIAVKPMPKPGWQIEVAKGPYNKTYSYFHGAKLSEGVKEVSWTGNLPDTYYEEFVLFGYIAGDLGADRTIYFPVVQDCEKGTHRWIEIPAPGHGAEHLKEPAPGITIVPKK